MFYKLSRYLKKKGISDVELLKIVVIAIVSGFFIGVGLYGAIGALL